MAVDLAHLLSELMENATHFSPPDTTVEIVGPPLRRAATSLSVSDQGIGMSADQLAEANRQLARPPLVGLALQPLARLHRHRPSGLPLRRHRSS